MPIKQGFPDARSMTRAEMKAFREAGLDPMFREEKATVQERVQENSEMVDWLMDNVYGDYDTANAPYSDCIELGLQTYNLSYGREVEIKNSSTSGTGTQEAEQNTVETA